MGSKSKNNSSKGPKQTDAPNPKGQRVLVYKNGVRPRLEWRTA